MRLTTATEEFLADKRDGHERAGGRRCAVNTLQAYQTILRQLVVFVVSTTARDAVTKVSGKMLRDFLAHEDARGLAKATMGLATTVIREFARWGYHPEVRHWRFDDVGTIRPRPKVKRLARPYDATERDAIFRLALEPKDALLRGLLYYGMLRRSEATALNLRDVSPPHWMPDGTTLLGALRVRGKGDKERQVEIHPHLWPLLADVIRPRKGEDLGRPLLVKSDGERWTDDMVERRVKGWAAAAGVERGQAHRFRHTGATDLLDAGADLRQIQDILGHATIATTEGYLKLSNRRRAEAIAKLPSLGIVPTDCTAGPQGGDLTSPGAAENAPPP